MGNLRSPVLRASCYAVVLIMNITLMALAIYSVTLPTSDFAGAFVMALSAFCCLITIITIGYKIIRRICNPLRANNMRRFELNLFVVLFICASGSSIAIGLDRCKGFPVDLNECTPSALAIAELVLSCIDAVAALAGTCLAYINRHPSTAEVIPMYRRRPNRTINHYPSRQVPPKSLRDSDKWKRFDIILLAPDRPEPQSRSSSNGSQAMGIAV
ncbi:hypothetical protein EW146_g5995 [Bondarzewia mesenterica]|uniref:MARVEL domain-containing protein n=1 Tax=Bondarzewia mesenterica TaxID=1095465 RepID=A0A4S4LQG2_9AGAM|nr:hypothetical protein EW146_g5995 [Bondarzewia mesenterica]